MKLFLVENKNYNQTIRLSEALLTYLVDELDSNIFAKTNLSNYKPDHVLQINIHIKDIEGKQAITEGPFYSKNLFNWVINIPENKLLQSDNYNISFVELFFEGFTAICKHYKADVLVVNKTLNSIRNEIQQNTKKYQLSIQEIEQLNWVNEIQQKYNQ